MSFEFKRFCQEHGIRLAPVGHKHVRPGWTQIECPFCSGNPGYHLGYEEAEQRFNCWRCGFHRSADVISKLLDVPLNQALQIFRQYRGRPVLRERKEDLLPILPKRSRLPILLPYGSGPLTSMHRTYLSSRKFDPSMLERTWDLRGTRGLGPYKFRVIAPIYFEGVRVSFQGRDITGKSRLRYKACPREKELIHHKHLLYGYDLARKKSDRVIIVEGIADAWRLGPGAVATFGIRTTRPQIALLKTFSRRYILFDSDGEAPEQAEKLAHALTAFPGDTFVVSLPRGVKDPGEMNQKEADSMVEDLLP